MSQLVFQPSLDPFHAVFRLIRLLPLLKVAGPLPIDHVRILDFYLLFPFRIRLIRLAQSHQHFKKLSEEYAHLTPYGEQPDPPLLFERMHPLQLAAIETLAANNYIDKDAFLDDIFKTSAAKVPEAISARAEELNAAQANLLEFIRTLAEHYTLSDGLNGLKARTGLMEYRYDTV